jgi:bacterioferritin-associated ferredoxin
MTTVSIETSKGQSTLNLKFDDHFRVLSAQSLTDGSQEEVLDWLCQWLPGKVLSEAQHNAAEILLTSHPQWGLKEAQLVDELLKEALYRTHPKVEVSGVIICNCHKVSKEVILNAIGESTTREQLTAQTKAGSGCGKCISVLEQMIVDKKPKAKRWNGKANSQWIIELQESLNHFSKRRADLPKLLIVSFKDGAVKVSVEGTITADQEWDLVNDLTQFWAEGFPAGLAVFLDFSLTQSAKN